jgi:hypothetical protein
VVLCQIFDERTPSARRSVNETRLYREQTQVTYGPDKCETSLVTGRRCLRCSGAWRGRPLRGSPASVERCNRRRRTPGAGGRELPLGRPAHLHQRLARVHAELRARDGQDLVELSCAIHRRRRLRRAGSRYDSRRVGAALPDGRQETAVSAAGRGDSARRTAGAPALHEGLQGLAMPWSGGESSTSTSTPPDRRYSGSVGHRGRGGRRRRVRRAACLRPPAPVGMGRPAKFGT